VVRDGLVVNVEYGIVEIVRKATKTLVKNVDRNRIQNRKRKRKRKRKIMSQTLTK
jgi:Ethanolamine utilization protein EutJ (predicted chaperonin)